MLQKTTFLRVHSWWEREEQVPGSFTAHGCQWMPSRPGGQSQARKRQGSKEFELQGCSSLLLTPSPVFYWCVQVQRLRCLPWLPRFHSHVLSAGDQEMWRVVLPGVKNIKSSVLEEHGRQNQGMKTWLQGSQRDAHICACQSFFVAAVIVDIYFSSLQWNSVC